MISKELYIKYFSGYHIYDCSVRSKDIVVFLLLENIIEDVEPKKTIFTFAYAGDKQGKFGDATLTGYAFPKLIAATKPEPHALISSLRGDVFVTGPGRGGDDDIPMSCPNRAMDTSVHALANIEGYVYAVGPWRSVAKREDFGKWINMSDREGSMPSPKPVNGSTDSGFDAISAFNAQDIYCVGGKGDVWRFDGKHWHQCELTDNKKFIQSRAGDGYVYRESQAGKVWRLEGKRWHQCEMITDKYLQNVCCAEDGYVYIGYDNGSVLKGRENEWKVIIETQMAAPFADMVWYDGRVWCTSENGLWVIEKDKLIEADVPAEIRACSGHLSVGDGIMLLAGNYGAAVYDGKKWEVIVSVFAYSK